MSSKVTMNVRKAGEGARVIDIQGEVNAAAESALMEAYNQASNARVIVLNFN